MEKIKITQVRSTIKCPERQKLVMKALKLGKINRSIEVEYTPQIQGMIRLVGHLIATENII